MGSEDSAKTKQLLKRSVDLYRQGDRIGALKALGSALEISPELDSDENVRKLASRITSLPEHEAIRTATDFERRNAFIQQRRKPIKNATRPQWVVWMVVAVIVVIIAGAVGIYIFNNTVAPLIAPNFANGQVERRTVMQSPDVTYQFALPVGTLPETGWPTLIAIHDVGQSGQDIVNAFHSATQANGILLIAPNFDDMPSGQYRDDGSDFYAEARNQILLILDDMQFRSFERRVVTPHFLGQVYFGNGTGGDFVAWLAQTGLDYSDAGFSMDTPLGISLANGALSYFNPVAPQMPYILLQPGLSNAQVLPTVQLVGQIYGE